jgi:hypothetical protein
MIPMLGELSQRRAGLVARCAVQREALAQAFAPYAGKLATLDRIGQALRSHPLIAFAGAAALALVGPRKLLRWALRGLSIFSLVRRLT